MSDSAGPGLEIESEYPHCAQAFQWADDVLNGTIPSCVQIKMMAERFKRDLERDDITLDYDEAETFIDYFEELPHVKGEWAQRGESITLQPWQKFKFMNVFGLMKTHKDGEKRRKYREVYAELPRKQGKSVDAAGVGLFMGFADGEFGAEVYCGATSEKQANEVFMPASLMVSRDDGLREFLGCESPYKQSVFRTSDNSLFQRVIGKPPDGPSPHCGIVDEYHEHKHDEVYKTFQTGMGSRRQPLLYVITTAGDNLEGPCHQKREEAMQILHGVLDDDHADSTFVMIFTIECDDLSESEQEDFWKTEKALRMANPNFDVSISGEWLLTQQSQAIRSLKDQGYFKTKHLNIWVNQVEPFINYEDWKRCGDKSLKVEDFGLYQCKMGVDLASKLDFTASCKVFYEDDLDGKRHYYLFPRFWLPEAQRKEYSPEWHPYITFTDGEEMDTQLVKNTLKEDMENYMIDEVTFDPWKSIGFEQELSGHTNAEITTFPQTVAQYIMPMGEFEAAIISGRLHHTDNPVFNWMLTNLHARRDTNGGCKPRREDKTKKIDAIVAAIMGIGRAMGGEETPSTEILTI